VRSESAAKPEMNALNSLTEINLDDLVASFGWRGKPGLVPFLRYIFKAPARKFAQQMLAYDAAVGELGLPEASRLTLQNFAQEMRLFADALPEGPLLALSNHPGICDTLALFSALNRPDMKIIATNRPFLQSLPNISKRLFYVTDDPTSRMALVRQVSAHLRSGGAVLTFPAGQIEPDPDVYPGAVESLRNWTESVGVFLRLAPETTILPVLVRGVIWHRTAHSPAARLKSTRKEREQFAAALQLLAHVMWNRNPLRVRIQIGSPVRVNSLGARDTNTIHQTILAEMQRMIENPPAVGGATVV